jgi:hypothetical protein
MYFFAQKYLRRWSALGVHLENDFRGRTGGPRIKYFSLVVLFQFVLLDIVAVEFSEWLVANS